MAGGSAVVSVSAAVLSKNICKFQGSSALTLAFGNISPASGTPATASASLAFSCGGAALSVSYALNQDSGMYKTGPNANRMKHATLAAYLPYTFTLTPSSGTVAKNVTQNVTVSGSVAPADFQGATMGVYADTVVITLNP